MSDIPNATKHLLVKHDSGLAIQVNSAKIKLSSDKYDQIMSKWELEHYTAHVRIQYKRKDKKIHLANVTLPAGVNPEGGVNQAIPRSQDSKLSQGRIIPCGFQLTLERLASMNIGGDVLSDAKNSFLLTFLYCVFSVFSWCFTFQVLLNVFGNGNAMSERHSLGFDSCRTVSCVLFICLFVF